MELPEEESKVIATIFLQFNNFCRKRKLERLFGPNRTWRLLESLKKKRLVESNEDGFVFLTKAGLKVLKVNV
jgi:uncharacterized protein YjhX (UPF0386 family)